MSILVDENTCVVVRGITGKEGGFHARQCMDYGTRVVAGVTPGKGGERAHGLPVFDTMGQAMRETGANACLIFVPAPFAADAILEDEDEGIPLIACITEGIPVRDMIAVHDALKGSSSRLIGPNCPGIITPGKCKMGIMPGAIHSPGPVGVISRSGTLNYEVVDQLTRRGIGQSTCVGIGGDPIVGSSFVDMLRLFREDPETHAVVLIGEIGGAAEEEAAALVREGFGKPVVAFIAGQTAPPGKRMGHAGAIISGGQGAAEEKVQTLKAAGVAVAADASEVGEIVEKVLGLGPSR